MSTMFPKPHDKYPVLYLKDTDALLPKHVVNNKMRYGEFKVIAKGGKCLIQSCRDYHLGRVVCYKSLLPEIADDPLEQKRLLREARVSAMLQHPNTIPTYELSRDPDGHYYFTMKLVHGITMREVLDGLKENDPDIALQYDLGKMVDVLIQIAHALDYAMSHGVVHRDIKPGNMLIGPFGEVLLLDWGLAKVWDQEAEHPSPHSRLDIADPKDRTLTSQGRLQATPLYMSPEQVAECPDLDHRTDLYSLGAVLYEALTLQYLAWGETMDELLHHTRYDEPQTPREKAPDREIPAELEDICMRCIAKNPDDRFATAGEIVKRLQAWRLGAPVSEAHLS